LSQIDEENSEAPLPLTLKTQWSLDCKNYWTAALFRRLRAITFARPSPQNWRPAS